MNHALDPATVKIEAMTQNLAAILRDLFKSNRRTKYPPRSTPPVGTKKVTVTEVTQSKKSLQFTTFSSSAQETIHHGSAVVNA